MFIKIKNVILREEDIKNISIKPGDKVYLRIIFKDDSTFFISCETEEEAFKLVETTWDKVNPANKKKGWLF
ncbi:hypothetical protein [Terrisporobacter sp.]|uniref:hypothetical protein n=1 Tax=Terrisporobacter sp. TaxID=1965305 RepID=UPI002896CF3B|nr:hypothetical protein [Terrisporobacter sp.]